MIWAMRLAVPVLGLVAGLAPLTAAGQSAPHCPPGQVPNFVLGFAALRDQLRDIMGEPAECEHPDPESGDILQRTTTGLAVYRRATNTPNFTDGYRRWSVGGNGLLYWESPVAHGLQIAWPLGGRVPWTRSLRCPILYGHEVPSQGWLRRLLSGLAAGGYRFTSLHTVDEAMSGLRDPPPGCLVLTFDDALYSQYQHALPVLAELGVPAAFFAMPGFADGVRRYMGAGELRALHRAGLEVMAHTCNHPNLPALARRDQLAFLAEVLDCKRMLEAIVGAAVPYLAYPSGAYNAEVIQAVAGAGYRAAFTTRPSAHLRADAPFALPRIRLGAGESVAAILQRIREAGG